jgi:hypothetical protein
MFLFIDTRHKHFCYTFYLSPCGRLALDGPTFQTPNLRNDFGLCSLAIIMVVVVVEDETKIRGGNY